MIPTTIIALGGQTSSGKSEMAIDLAKKLEDCWIIGCDSRQIYKYLNLGTGKIDGNWEMIIHDGQLTHTYLSQGVPHFFIDTVDPNKQYSLAEFLSDFRDFCNSHTLPKYLILCGGTGLYIKAILERYDIPQLCHEHEEKYNKEKSKLEKLSLIDLQQIHDKQDGGINLNQSDYQNPRRLINKILTKTCLQNSWSKPVLLPEFEALYNFAIDQNQENLTKKIEHRIITRIELGMVEEVSSLSFLGSNRLINLGLEYRLTHLYLLGQLSYTEYIQKLTIDSVNYAQRQLTWLKKQRVNWITSSQDIIDKIKAI
jgi:tRNA dimethylallyltransferase